MTVVANTETGTDGKSYRPSPIRRRRRRSLSEIDHIKDRLRIIAYAERPATVRQLFYRLVSEGAIAKTEAEYKGTVCRLLADMRRARELPFSWIADNTRWMRKPDSFSSLENALHTTADFYRRRLWDDQGVYVAFWLRVLKKSFEGLGGS